MENKINGSFYFNENFQFRNIAQVFHSGFFGGSDYSKSVMYYIMASAYLADGVNLPLPGT